MNKEDIKYALKQMGATIKHLTIDALRMIGIILGVATIICVVGYCFMHWFWQFVVVFVMSALTGWFWMELDSARRQREWEAECKAYWADRTKPAEDE